MTKDEEIKLLRKNISDLQEQVQNCYIRIKELNDEIYGLKSQPHVIIEDARQIKMEL